MTSRADLMSDMAIELVALSSYAGFVAGYRAAVGPDADMDEASVTEAFEDWALEESDEDEAPESPVQSAIGEPTPAFPAPETTEPATAPETPAQGSVMASGPDTPETPAPESSIPAPVDPAPATTDQAPAQDQAPTETPAQTETTDAPATDSPS